MALIKCPECDVDVSEHAIACPKCAFPVSEAQNININNSVPLTKKELRAAKKANREWDDGDGERVRNAFKFALVISIFAFLISMPVSCVFRGSIVDLWTLLGIGAVFIVVFIFGLIMVGLFRLFDWVGR